jgi:hypothetical protein
MSTKFHFIPSSFKISELREWLHTEIEAIGGISLVLIDTSSAYFEGLDENDNRQAGDHARMLRSLTDLPAALVSSSPVIRPRMPAPAICSRAAAAPSLPKWTAI